MNWATMVVLIVLIAVVGRIIVARQKAAPQERHDSEKAMLRREVAELKQRIATLEKIATDRSGRLAKQIEELSGTDQRDDTVDKEKKD